MLAAALAWSPPAIGQSVYVAGAIGAEVVRTSSTESGGSTFDTGSGDAFAGAIRVGTSITPVVGVELEFYRPGEIESDDGGPFYLPALDLPLSIAQGIGGSTISGLYPTGLQSFIGQTTRVRTSTTSALLFARQSLGSRVSLAYLGGVGFSRVVRETEFGFPRIIVPLPPGILPGSYSTRTTQYGAGPVVGVELRAGMTEHMQLVAGLRAHTLRQSLVDGWMIRPSVGLAWKF
jgi:hypothetical protein